MKELDVDTLSSEVLSEYAMTSLYHSLTVHFNSTSLSCAFTHWLLYELYFS